MMASETLSLNAGVQLPHEGEGTCRMGRLFTFILFLLGHLPYEVVFILPR